MATIVQAIRSDKPEMRPRLPDTRSCRAGEILTIEYKRSGQVVFTERFVCVLQMADDGEPLKHWEQLEG